MIKEKRQYEFIKDFAAAIAIFKDFCPSRYIEVASVGKNDAEGYYAEINYIVPQRKRTLRPFVIGTYRCVLVNDYEVLCLDDKTASRLNTQILREHQTKAIGKEYVDSLEEFLTQNVQTEVSKYRKLLEEQD